MKDLRNLLSDMPLTRGLGRGVGCSAFRTVVPNPGKHDLEPGRHQSHHQQDEANSGGDASTPAGKDVDENDNDEKVGRAACAGWLGVSFVLKGIAVLIILRQLQLYPFRPKPKPAPVDGDLINRRRIRQAVAP